MIIKYFRYDRLQVGTPWMMSNVSNIYDSYQQNYDEIDGYIMIKFTSDGSVNKRGFRIEYYLGNGVIASVNRSVMLLENDRPFFLLALYLSCRGSLWSPPAVGDYEFNSGKHYISWLSERLSKPSKLLLEA